MAMRIARCERCNSKIKKVVCGTMFCAKTNPMKKITLKDGELRPEWCPKRSAK